jgi:hypothetical protein
MSNIALNASELQKRMKRVDRTTAGEREIIEKRKEFVVLPIPIVDPTYVSAMNANRIVRECLTGMAMRKLGLADKHYLSPLTTGHGQGK